MTRTCRLSVLALAFAIALATPAVADTFLVYSQAGLPQQTSYFQWCLEGEPFCLAGQPVNCATPEGGSFQQHSSQFNANGQGSDGYVGWGVFPFVPLDMTSFAGGNLRWFVRLNPPNGNATIKLEFECNPDPVTYPAGVSYATSITAHGWQANNTWQEIVVPLVDSSFTAFDLSTVPFTPIVRPLDAACLSKVKALAKTTLERVDFATVFATMSVDFIRWEKPNNHPGATRVETQGHQLLVNGKPFVVNAVDYAPVGIGQNWQAAWQDRPDRYNVDFPLIADMGANAVRLYAPVLSKAMLDKAWSEGLFVIPTFGVDAIQLTCATGRAFMRDRFVQMVNEWKDHPAILFWLVGNEVNRNLGTANLCTDWYPQLDAMAAAAHAAEGASFHPVGTAVAGMADVCNSCSDDLDLPNVDLWGVQLYLGCNFGTAFSDYALKPNCDRPLIVTEFGVDAYDDDPPPAAGENQAIQASCLDTLLEDAHMDLAVRPGGLGVLAGQAIFEWADEWWKAECSPTTSWSVHDTCVSSFNGGFPDGKVHEEWFGIATLASGAGNGNVRGLRTAYDTVGDQWLGPVCGMKVSSFDKVTGNATISFRPAAGNAVDHNLHYGPLNAVSSYGYSGSIMGLGTTGSSPTITLPAGSLFWVVAAENAVAEEGCYGTNSAGTERPCFSANCDVAQTSGWNCWCSTP